MGKKTKKGKGKKAGSAKKPKKTTKNDLNMIDDEEKENLLEIELETLNKCLEDAKKEIIDLKMENERIEMESNRVRLENHEYMAYIDKKTSKRQNNIISLSDQNRYEIEKLTKQKHEMAEEFNRKREYLQNILLEKENQLARIKEELQNLDEAKVLQKEQAEMIQKLEKEIMEARREQTAKLNEIKQNFIIEKEKFQQEAEYTIKETTQKANQAAEEYLNTHTHNLKVENTALRRQLLKLIRQTRILEAHKIDLEKQYQDLVRERQYAEDLKKIRIEKHDKIIKFNQDKPELVDILAPQLSTLSIKPENLRSSEQLTTSSSFIN